MKKTFLFLNLVLFSIVSFAQTTFELIEKVEAEEGKLVIPYEKYKLPSNGLTLMIHEDHSDPVSHVQVAYHVGSARESPGHSGYAHFFEHMMFQGSKNIADEEHFRIVSEGGGTNNGNTSTDRTVYLQTAPSNLTETMLWLEADRMGTHLEGFTQKKFDNQRNAVKNEKKEGDNVPYGLVGEVRAKLLYAGHPYEWSPIGYLDDLNSASAEDMKNFFLRWYGPNNATVIVTGDVNTEEVKQWVEKYYGGIPKGPEVKKMYPKKPFLSMDYYTTITDDIYYPLTSFSFPTVPRYHKDEAPLDVLSSILGGGSSSILYKNLVKNEKAVQTFASNGCSELAGSLDIQVTTAPGKMTYKEVEDAIRASLLELETSDVSAEDINIVKNSILMQFYGQMGSIDSKAGLLVNFALFTKPGFNIQQDIDRYSNVTKADVLRVYNKYIKGKKAIIIRVERDNTPKADRKDNASKSVNPYAGQPKVMEDQYKGLSYTPPKDDFDRSIRPSIKPGKAVKVPALYKANFDNGLKIIGIDKTDDPLIYIQISIKGGQLLEQNKKIDYGTGVLTAIMLDKGTSILTKEEFSRKMDILGSSIFYGSGQSSSSITVISLPENLDATLAMLKDQLNNPRFDEGDFKKEKQDLLDNIKSNKNSVSYLAGRAYSELMYEGTILANSISGSFKSVSKISLEDVKAFYKNYYSPSVATVSIVSNLTESEAVSKIAFLKEWERKEVTITPIPELKTPGKTVIYLVDKPYVSQSIVIAGHPSSKIDFDGDHYKSTVMNYSLGGAFNSRVNLNLREDKGYTYGARTSFSADDQNGEFIFSSAIKREATDSAIDELMKEIKGYVEKGITKDELEFTKSSMKLSEARSYETSFSKLRFLNIVSDYNLDPNYRKKQAEILDNITAEDINKIAKETLHPENMYIVVAGHSYKIKKGLERLGYEVKEITVD
jgi:zinc protease